MEVKVKFNELNVKEENEQTLVKVLMLKGEKGEPGTSDYNELINKPTKLSDFTNDGVFITASTDNLENYYKKAETYTQTETNNLLNAKANTSDLSTVATSGSYDDLSNKPTIPTKTSELTNDSNFVSSSSLATVATSGSYDDLSNKPTIPTKTSELTNDSNFVSSSSLATVATSGSYDDLSNKPTIPTKTSELTNDSNFVSSSSLATVATSGSYSDLSNKPTIPTKTSELTNDSNFVSSSSLATVATSGSYDDLSNKPTIPTKTSELTNDSDFVSSSSLATVATSGSYTDLSNKPTIPTIRASYYGSDNNSAYSTNYINGLSCFSTSEKRLGTWINGSTLYRKTIQFIITGVESTYYTYDTGISNANIMIIDPAYSFISYSPFLVMINSARGNGTALSEHWNWFRVEGGGVIAYAFGSAIANVGGASCVLTLNYTKS